MFEAPGRPEEQSETSKRFQILLKPSLLPACLYTGTGLLRLDGTRPVVGLWLRMATQIIVVLRLRRLWSDLGKLLAKYTRLRVTR